MEKNERWYDQNINWFLAALIPQAYPKLSTMKFVVIPNQDRCNWTELQQAMRCDPISHTPMEPSILFPIIKTMQIKTKYVSVMPKIYL
jgi:hypothetical protein